MPKEYVKFEVPKELIDKILQTVEIARNTGKVSKGTNETTKVVASSVGQLVVIAGDVEPAEIVMHLPALCDEKKIPYVYVPNKVELGRAVGIDVGAASVCIVEPGEGKEQLKEVLKNIEKLSK